MIVIGDCVLSPWSEILQYSSACAWQCTSFSQVSLLWSWGTAKRGNSETRAFDAISI